MKDEGTFSTFKEKDYEGDWLLIDWFVITLIDVVMSCVHKKNFIKLGLLKTLIDRSKV